MKPTNEDLARLIPEAAKLSKIAGVDGQVDPQNLARAARNLLLQLLGVVGIGSAWEQVRTLALHALYLCALIAWDAGRRMMPPARMFVNDGNGGVRPLDGPADEPTAKSVDALLRDADALHPGRAEAGLVRDLAAALRAERERHADTARCLGESEAQCRQEHERAERLREAGEHVEGLWQSANGHLRAVLAQGWPDGTTGPEVVRKARAFLAGEEQALRHDDTRELELLRKELADKSATLERMVERHERVTRELSRMTNDRNEWKAVADAIGPAFQNDLTKLRAQLATEDEAHAHTQARLAEVEKDRDAERRTRINSYKVAQDALAAQNRAESEAASLRVEVTDLRRTVSEGETLVESLIAWAKKGRA